MATINPAEQAHIRFLVERTERRKLEVVLAQLSLDKADGERVQFINELAKKYEIQDGKCVVNVDTGDILPASKSSKPL